MPTHKLPHYLRSHRKRIGFSQDELASLLGCRSGAKVSRYERFTRKPSLETLFAYQVVFRVPADELFGGIYEAAKEVTHRRVKFLIKRLTAAGANPATAAKIAALHAIIESKATHSTGDHA